MGDLEAKILDGGRSGKSACDSPWRYEDDSGSEEELILDAPEHQQLSYADVAASAAAHLRSVDPLAERQTGPRAGPKGVRADKVWDDAQRRKSADRAAMRKADALRCPTLQGPSMSLSSQIADEKRNTSSSRRGDGPLKPTGESGSAGNSTDDDDGCEDDTFFAAYRSSRLAELRAVAALSSWGIVEEIEDRFSYSDVIDATDPRCFACVLLYEDFIPVARRLRLDVLPSAAELFPHARFLAVRSSVTSDSFDPIALPALLVYRDKRLVCSILRVHEELGADSNAALPNAVRGGAPEDDDDELHGAARGELISDRVKAQAGQLAALLLLRHDVDLRGCVR